MMTDKHMQMGHMKEGVHHFPVRVYYEDTDAQGIVYHANYLRYAERARTEFLRLIGVPHQDLVVQHNAGFSVRQLTIHYAAPARIDDALVVQTVLQSARGAVMVLRQTIHHCAASLASCPPLVAIDLTLACLNQHGRPTRLPRVLLDALDHSHARP